MSYYPTHYYDAAGRANEGAARAADVFEVAKRDHGLGEDDVALVIRLLVQTGMVVTLAEEQLEGVVSRVRIDVFGRSAAEVETALLAYGSRCDGAAQRPSCIYGECVIERNLLEGWGEEYSWKGRLALHPDIGMVESSQRAKMVIDRESSTPPSSL